MGGINGRVIYSPKGKAAKYADNAANFFVGCSNGCTYCYLRKGIGAKVLGGNRPELKKTLREYPYAIDIFTNELLKHKEELQKTGLFFSFTTDPLLPETQRLTRQAIGVCQRHNVPVKVLSKCAEGINILIDFVEASAGWDKTRIAIGSTLTGCDELEPNASPNRMRISTLARAKRHGFPTFASVEPIPPGMFDRAFSVIALSYPFVDLFKIGLQSGCRYTKKETLGFYNDVAEYWEAHPHTTPRLYWKESFVKASGINRDLLPGYCVPANYDLFNQDNNDYAVY